MLYASRHSNVTCIISFTLHNNLSGLYYKIDTIISTIFQMRKLNTERLINSPKVV